MGEKSKIIEEFSVNRELGLRSLLFALLFYVIASPVISKYLNRNIPRSIEVLAFQAFLFGVLFYLVNLYL